VFASALSACAPPVNRDARIPLGPVAQVDLDEYSGLWYEIARLPDGEDECYAGTVQHLMRDDARIDMIETCLDGGLDGEERVRTRTARVVDPATNAKLEVGAFWPFARDYWVLDRAEDYAWTVVGEPRGRYLWIYAREPTIPVSLRRDLLSRLQARGYRTEALRWTTQDETKGRARRTFARD
jgi:apolipoprotein D and lipocalin family protein